MSNRSGYIRSSPFLISKVAERGKINEDVIGKCSAIIRSLEERGVVTPNRQFPIFPGEHDNVKRTMREARFYLVDLITHWNAEQYPFFTENGATSGSDMTVKDLEDYFEEWYSGCRAGAITTHNDPNFI